MPKLSYCRLSHRPRANRATLASRVSVLVASGAYPRRPNTPIPRSCWPLLSFSATTEASSSFKERYCEKLDIVNEVSFLKLVGRPAVGAVPRRAPTAWGTRAGDNCPNGDSRSMCGSLVQLNAGEIWPGRPPSLYETIAVR